MQERNETEQIESRAATVEEAISEALLRLGARRDEVEITVVEEGRAGVLGVFGRRQARVLATRKKKQTRGKRGGRRRSGAPPDARAG
ncbi:Jag N-terminal domain-containing protein, partial [bacterium]|nr:Jag N-terminal domain-containing protein [bacterium]